MAASDIRRMGTSENFNPKMAVIVTYVNVSSYGNSNLEHTFQMVLATDYFESYVILLYKKLDSNGAVTGFNEKTCDNFLATSRSPYSNLLVSNSNVNISGMFVYKLSQPHCQMGDTPPITFASVKTYDTGLMMTYSIRHNPKTDVKVVFTQVVSGIFPSSSFLVERVKFTTRYSIQYIYNVIAAQRNYFATQLMFVTDGVNRTSSLQYGSIYLPSFSSRFACKRLRFKEQLNKVPVVKLNGEVKFNPSKPFLGFTSLWLQSVNTHTFDVCYKEMFSFSGPRSITVDYIAITETAISGVNGTFSEVGTSMFYSGMVDTFFKDENERFCQTMQFKYRYHNIPYLFVTAEDANSTNTELISWVNRIYEDRAIVCAKSTLDEPTKRIIDIKLHYIANGKLDRCSLVKCPSNLQCNLDMDGEPTCGCIKSCNATDEWKICATDLITYRSMCELHKRVCEVYGINSTVNISIAYLGECKREYFYILTLSMTLMIFCENLFLKKFYFSMHLIAIHQVEHSVFVIFQIIHSHPMCMFIFLEYNIFWRRHPRNNLTAFTIVTQRHPLFK